MKLISWNIGHRNEPWRRLLNLDADVALLQEAAVPPAEIDTHRIQVDTAPWWTAGAGIRRPWRTAIVKLSDRVSIEWLTVESIDKSQRSDLAVSRLGTLAAAIVTPSSGKPIVVVSMYSVWEKPHAAFGNNWIYADASAHRLISDLSSLIGNQNGHRIIAAGDLNILHGYGEKGNRYWASRYGTVFQRMHAIGLAYAGPEFPHGRSAYPWPDELPNDSKNVPTYYTNNQSPQTATRQLDFVFISKNLRNDVVVKAINEPENWGPSDHCIVEIELMR